MTNATGLHLVNVNGYAKFHHNIPLGSRDNAIFTFSEFGPWHSLDRQQMSFCNLLARVYQNIPSGLRVIGVFRKLILDGHTTSQTDRGRTRVIIGHTESQPSASLVVDFISFNCFSDYRLLVC